MRKNYTEKGSGYCHWIENRHYRYFPLGRHTLPPHTEQWFFIPYTNPMDKHNFGYVDCVCVTTRFTADIPFRSFHDREYLLGKARGRREI